jgi:uncharacterized repeat protein (TIGR03803 family)
MSKVVVSLGCFLAISILANHAQAYTFKVIHSFCAKPRCADGALPNPGLAIDGAGNLYGTTFIGGEKDHGVIFKLQQSGKPGHWAYRTSWSFCQDQRCARGSRTGSPPIADANGNVYGLGPFADREGDFALYELAQDGSFSILYQFPTGQTPASRLSYLGADNGEPYDGASPLYGALVQSIFSLAPSNSGWMENTVYTFCSEADCADGSNPEAAPLVANAGTLFGTTVRGGARRTGVIYRLSSKPAGWKEAVLHSFHGGGSASLLTPDSSGALYGVAGGGKFQQGVVFKLAVDRTYSVLHNFCPQTFCEDGAAPESGVTLDDSGNIFGVTSGGGVGSPRTGTVYEVSGKSETVLHSFCSEPDCADGEVPVSTLLMDGNGNLFGTTRGGGANPSLEGTVFEISP